MIGAGGFIGLPVVEQFFHAGYDVIGINRSKPDISPDGVKWVIGDGHDLNVVLNEGESVPADPKISFDAARINIYQDDHLVRPLEIKKGA